MTLNVSLTPQLEKMVKTKVASGAYNSASEVVREALRLLEEKDQIRKMRLENLKKEIQKGVDSGPGIPADEFFARLLQRYEDMAKKARKSKKDDK